jgi:ATP-dependent exoDNAse (exonuclease V) beta subunit
VEEEKRLLYVALTRARKNLVLSAARTSESEGERTLLQLLPASLRKVFDAALTTTDEELPWEPKGETHRLRIIKPGAEPLSYDEVAKPARFRLALEALSDESPSRLSVGAFVQEQTGEPFNLWALDPLDLAVGSAVHRMFEYSVPADGNLEQVAYALFPETPGRPLSERRAAAATAAELYRSLRHQPELARLMKNGRIYREVPFSLARGDRVIRGTIDALVAFPGEVVVVDYKTGTVRTEHRMQMELYLEAARALFPEHELQGLVFYPSGDPLKVNLPQTGAGTSSQMKLF